MNKYIAIPSMLFFASSSLAANCGDPTFAPNKICCPKYVQCDTSTCNLSSSDQQVFKINPGGKLIAGNYVLITADIDNTNRGTCKYQNEQDGNAYISISSQSGTLTNKYTQGQGDWQQDSSGNPGAYLTCPAASATPADCPFIVAKI